MTSARKIPAAYLPRHDFVRNLVVVNGPVLQLFHGEFGSEELYLRHLLRRDGGNAEWFLARVLRIDLLRLLGNHIGLRELLTTRISGGAGWHVTYSRGDLTDIELMLTPPDEFLPATDAPLGDLLEPEDTFTIFTGDRLDLNDIFLHLRRVQALYCYVGISSEIHDGRIPNHPFSDGFSTLHLRREVYHQVPEPSQPKLLGVSVNSPGYMRVRGDEDVVRRVCRLVVRVSNLRQAIRAEESRLANYLSYEELNEHDAVPQPHQIRAMQELGANLLQVLTGNQRTWSWALEHSESVFDATKFALIYCREALRVSDGVAQELIVLPVVNGSEIDDDW